ncbi:hypothetical protein B9Z55_012315 [Caenorhabditis nigoni]|uniref:F-box domain-containing protein n=1 Tax=Caenorhabditis nigoni TaxID=1611254 RepID=A0A2G5TWS9_9PELO|nr:hypothetical protein B9Z55_012315 [Caenorhabditis nigoni]
MMKFLQSFLSCWKFPIQGKLSKKSKAKPRNGFPLLNLPRVVLLECIENLDVLEIIIFSFLSKQAKSIAKLINWTPLNIHLLYGGGTICVRLKLSTAPGLQWIIAYTNEKKLSAYPYFHSYLTGPEVKHCLVLRYDGNTIEDSKHMAEHICEVFHSTIDGIDIGQESQIEWLIKFQPTIRHVSICDDVHVSAKTLDRISKSLKVTEYFGVGSIATDEEFQITGPIPSRSVTIDNSCWITLPSILNGTNSIIRLNESKLTPMDINTILKEWQKGTKLQNLEYLEIKTSPVDSFTGEDADNYTNALFHDLDLTESADDDERPLTVKIDDEFEYTLREVETMNNLIRSDGMIGSIFEIIGEFERDGMLLCFYFQVWRKQT